MKRINSKFLVKLIVVYKKINLLFRKKVRKVNRKEIKTLKFDDPNKIYLILYYF